MGHAEKVNPEPDYKAVVEQLTKNLNLSDKEFKNSSKSILIRVAMDKCTNYTIQNS